MRRKSSLNLELSYDEDADDSEEPISEDDSDGTYGSRSKSRKKRGQKGRRATKRRKTENGHEYTASKGRKQHTEADQKEENGVAQSEEANGEEDSIPLHRPRRTKVRHKIVSDTPTGLETNGTPETNGVGSEEDNEGENFEEEAQDDQQETPPNRKRSGLRMVRHYGIAVPVGMWSERAMNDDELRQEIDVVKKEIALLEKEVEEEEKREKKRKEATAAEGEKGDEDDEYELELFEIPPHCIPIRADVRTFDWKRLANEVQFDVITMDPPWQLAGAMPTRGVALSYKQLPNSAIAEIPIPQLQERGFIFIWVINNRYAFALELLEKWGYKLVDTVTWVKSTVNRRMAKGHGFYLQHAKETCLVGKKGPDPPGMCGNVLRDVIYSERRGQSQKPEEIYTMIESLVPNGKYLEIFARRNNLRNYWVSVGLEL